MNDMRWRDGEVLVEDRVDAPRGVTGAALHDTFFQTASRLSLGLIQYRERALRIGPIELLSFGEPKVEPNAVSWPIEGGVLAASPGGTIAVSSENGHLEAKVDRYRPALPMPVYSVTQLPAHHALVRLQLLHLRGRLPAPGVPADVSGRLAAGAIDAVICAGGALALARRRRIRALLVIAAGYHVAAWAVSGRTIGGAILRQRVVSIDGSLPSPGQAVLRFAALPLALFRMRALHDEIAATDVVTD